MDPERGSRKAALWQIAGEGKLLCADGLLR